MSILQELLDLNEAAESEKIEAYGVKGMKSTPWRKTFKNQAEYEKWLEKNEGDIEVQGTRKLEEAASLEEDLDQLDEKVFDEDKYTWYVWTQSKPSQSFDRRGGSKQLSKGMQFGLRPATSKAGTWRLIMKQKGPSIIFSIDDDTAKTVAKQALELI